MYELLHLHLRGRPGVVGGAPGWRRRRTAASPSEGWFAIAPAPADPLLARQPDRVPRPPLRVGGRARAQLLCRLAGCRAPLLLATAAARGLLCLLLLSMLAAGGSAQPAPGPGEHSEQGETPAANITLQAAPCHTTSRVSLRPAPASHSFKGCTNPSLHAGTCALACWWMPFSGRSQHRHHRTIQQQVQGPVDLQEGGERGWTQGWTLWAALARVHDVLCMRQRAADAASSRLLSWVYGWWHSHARTAT
jgi:hypothetical protein